MTSIWIVLFAVTLVIMVPFCVISLKKRNLTWLDVAWALGVAVGAVLLGILSEGHHVRRIVTATIVLIWASRLLQHLIENRVSGAEDGRYSDLRTAMRQPQWIYVPLFYVVEALFVLMCLIPIQAAMSVARPFGSAFDMAGLAIFALAIGGESLADAQLERFRYCPSNAGRTCKLGLWKFSRHPNYFFEWLHWWTYVLFAVGSPQMLQSLAGPVLMYVFIRHITGIPHIERRSLRSRGNDYRVYQRTTNAFFPWLPRHQGVGE